MKLILPERAGEEKIRDFWARCEGRMGNPGAVWPRGRTYEEWLRDTMAYRTRPPQGKVPSVLLFLTDENETKLFGAASVRWQMNERVMERSGHIGYGIAPEERRKGYAKTQLRLALGVARILGVGRVLVTCLEENEASRRTIEACGGEYEDTREWQPGERLRRYWFTVGQPTLETERLRLRQWAREDAEDMFEYAKSPNVGPAAGWRPHEKLSDSEWTVEMWRGSGEVWAIEEKASGRVVGSIGLYRDRIRNDPMARSLGYMLSETRWGRGYMPEAIARMLRYGFEAIALENISILHYAENAQSHRVAEKCGFTPEGTLRHGVMRYDGTLHDLALWSMTRDEYFMGRQENVEAE